MFLSKKYVPMLLVEIVGAIFEKGTAPIESEAVQIVEPFRLQRFRAEDQRLKMSKLERK